MLRARSRVYSISPFQPFVDALAEGLLAQFGGAEPGRLADVLVLVPTRRAVRAMREAFLRRSARRALILPVVRAIGDIDEDELVFADQTDVDPGLVDPIDIPLAMPAMMRQLLLAAPINQWLKRKDRVATARGIDQAVRLAESLGRLSDQIHTARLDFSAIAGLVPDDYASHWQDILSFLEIVSKIWPRMLEDHGMIDAAERRNRLLDALAESWSRQPPRTPVIAAGSTGSIPATADLLQVIRGLPDGTVVLPGLDQQMDDESWACLDDGHPQFGLKQLLMHFDVDRGSVAAWPWTVADESPARARLISEVMRPAATTSAWYDLPPIDPTASQGLHRIDCPEPQSEAVVIALLMREVLETPDRTAALVTRDRNLARRVAAQLRRWEVTIDDSAGMPLANTVPGLFLRLIATMAAEQAAPAALLAVLKHPLATGGLNRAAFLALVRDLERVCLRGPRPSPGFAGLKRALRAGSPNKELRSWLNELAKAAGPFMKLAHRRRIAPIALIDAHISFVEWLARETDGGEGRHIWSGEAGEAASTFLSAMRDAVTTLPPIDAASYPALLDSLMAGIVVRPRFGTHPRLFVWGPLEARLQQADRIILGGLNEASWPGAIAPDPWLSRPMRHAVGLPAQERAIGLAAHDFCQLACASEVFLTRSQKSEGSPTVPSRWLVRLDTVLARHNTAEAIDQADKWRAWQEALDRPTGLPAPVARPAPRPPVSARPRRLSVTRIENLVRDPYDVYARDILKLKALDPIDADPGAADYGSSIHRVLDRFVREVSDPTATGALNELLEIGRQVFEPIAARPGAWAFWWPRFTRIAEWFVAQAKVRHADVERSWSERKGEMTIAGPAGRFVLTAIADRIDRARDGVLEIIDYKTGMVASRATVEVGLAPQLPLEAAILAAGGFKDIPVAPIGALSYWQLTAGDPAGQIKRVIDDGDAAGAAALAGLAALIAIFDDPATPYTARPSAAWAPRFSDYTHLARVLEWGTVDSGDDG